MRLQAVAVVALLLLKGPHLVQTVEVGELPSVEEMFSDISLQVVARSPEEARADTLRALELGGWRNPLEQGRLTSTFGERGVVPGVTGTGSFHNGVDLAADLGTEIVVAYSGTVLHVGFSDWGIHTGGIVVVEHETISGNYLTTYNHMQRSGIVVSEGQEVAAGQTIAVVGNEGLSSGPHLHLSVYATQGDGVARDAPDGTAIDPLAFFAERDLDLAAAHG